LKDSEQPGDTNAIEDPKNIDTAKLKRLNTIYFNTNEFFLDAVDRKILLSIAQSIEQGKYSTILILGHTDIKKGVDNQLLSQERAEAVADYIQNLSPSATLKKAWYGPNRPVTKALDKRSLQLNRRTEIYLIR
jgi:outer membrane protein OmpA-like peptidoglycan-associated protein